MDVEMDEVFGDAGSTIRVVAEFADAKRMNLISETEVRVETSRHQSGSWKIQAAEKWFKDNAEEIPDNMYRRLRDAQETLWAVETEVQEFLGIDGEEED